MKSKKPSFVIIKRIALVFVLAGAVTTSSMSGLSMARSVKARADIDNDRARFMVADKKKGSVFDRFLQKMDAPIRIEDRDICYNSGQGPFDHGRLWCQVSTAAYFSRPIPESQVENYFAESLKASGLYSESQLETWFDVTEGITCGFTVYSERFAVSPGYHFSDETASRQTALLYCIGDAAARHYEYIE